MTCRCRVLSNRDRAMCLGCGGIVRGGEVLASVGAAGLVRCLNCAVSVGADIDWDALDREYAANRANPDAPPLVPTPGRHRPLPPLKPAEQLDITFDPRMAAANDRDDSDPVSSQENS